MALSGHERRQAKKREEILAIATELFLKEGYGRASMDQVHARLGGSKRTLYNHFPSKEALFEAIVSRVSDRVLAALQPSLGDSDLQDALNRMGKDYLSALLSPDGLALYRAMVSEAPHFPELARTFFENGPSRASHHLAAFFREQKVIGNLDVDDPQIAAEQFLGAVRGDIHLAAVLSAKKFTSKVIEKSVAQVVGLFLRGAGH
ncbi:MAG: TetR/AcrR family transcriptional regulator [Roseibium sp.]|uniref:TetR/AcrR family transcriptional regulator n=1 Tax=Roseibium sp. TaxID=1936156 RepID=UPI002624BE60|nr:TetR/AcrR family transcriptional regulator [Roseibium sp.]MCV0429463.1 TetR/AcrR family transcriptional regulator [Roseibium sp.]